MDTDHDTRPPGTPPPPGARPPLGGMTRASDDVVISGLCGGLGRQFGIDPLVLRIAFVVMALAGGTGILLYLVGWALVPDDQGHTFGARWLPGSDRGHKLLAAGLAGIGLLLLFDQIFGGHGDDVPMGLVLVGLGAAVLWSRRTGRPLLPPAPATPPPAPPSGWTPPPAGPPGAPTWPAPPPAPAADSGEPPVAEAADSDVVTDPEVVTDPPGMSDPTIPLTAPPSAGSSSWETNTGGTRAYTPPPGPPTPPVYSSRRPRLPKPPKPPKPRSALVPVTFCLLAILAGGVVMAGADVVTGLALGLFVVAGAMIVGAWRGRARGLIPLAILISGALFVASVVDVPFKGGAGERLYTPISVAEVQSPYRLVAGEMRLDLRNLDLAGRTLPVVASMATGNIVVTVPPGVAVELRGRVGAGDMVVFGRDWAGVGVDEQLSSAGREGAGRLVLDLHVGFGQLEVRRAAA